MNLNEYPSVLRMLNMIVDGQNAKEYLTMFKHPSVFKNKDGHFIFPKVSSIETGVAKLQAISIMQNTKNTPISFFNELEKVLNVFFNAYDTNQLFHDNQGNQGFEKILLDKDSKTPHELTARLFMMKQSSRGIHDYKPHICIGLKSKVHNQYGFIELLHINCFNYLGRFSFETNDVVIDSKVFLHNMNISPDLIKPISAHFNLDNYLESGCNNTSYEMNNEFSKLKSNFNEIKTMIEACKDNPSDRLKALMAWVHIKNKLDKNDYTHLSNGFFDDVFNSHEVKRNFKIFHEKLPKIFIVDEIKLDEIIKNGCFYGYEVRFKITFAQDKVFKAIMGKDIANGVLSILRSDIPDDDKRNTIKEAIKNLIMQNDEVVFSLTCSNSDPKLPIVSAFCNQEKIPLNIRVFVSCQHFINALNKQGTKDVLVALFPKTRYVHEKYIQQHNCSLKNINVHTCLSPLVKTVFIQHFLNKEGRNRSFNAFVTRLEKYFNINPFVGIVAFSCMKLFDFDNVINWFNRLRTSGLLFFSCEVDGQVKVLSYSVLRYIKEIHFVDFCYGSHFVFDETSNVGIVLRLVNPSNDLKEIFKNICDENINITSY